MNPVSVSFIDVISAVKDLCAFNFAAVFSSGSEITAAHHPKSSIPATGIKVRSFGAKNIATTASKIVPTQTLEET